MRKTIKDMIDYLNSHIEYEHVMLDIKDKYNKKNIAQLTDEEVIELSTLYDF